MDKKSGEIVPHGISVRIHFNLQVAVCPAQISLYFVTVQSISHRCDFYRIHRCNYGCIYTNHNYINPNTLDKSVRMVYYHFSSVLFGRVWRCSLLYIWIMRACLLCPYVKYYFTIDVCTNSVFTLDIFVVWDVDGKFIVLCVSKLLFYSLQYIHFTLWTLIVHSYDFETVHDISSY